MSTYQRLIALLLTVSVGNVGSQTKFSNFNQLLAQFKFNVPDQHFTIVTPKILVDDIVTSLTKISCGKMGIGAMAVHASRPSDQKVTMAISFDALIATCLCDWKYEYLFDGSGTAIAKATAANKNMLHSSVSFSSTDYRTSLPDPDASAVDTCQASVAFQPMKFSGNNLGGDLIELFDGTVQSHIEDQLGTTSGLACKQLGSLGPKLFSSLIISMNANIEPFMPFMLIRPELCKWTGIFCFDALSAEKALQIPHNVELINFHENRLMQTIRLGMDALNRRATPKCHTTWRGDVCSGPLTINELALTLTGNTGAVVISDFFSVLGINATVTSANTIADTNLTITGLKLGGLDTFQKFDLLRPIGNFTVYNEIAMQELDVEISVTVVMKPHNEPGATVQGNTGILTEHVTLYAGLSNITLALGGLVAVTDAIASMKLGDVVQTPVGCLFSKVYDANITYANVTVADIVHPRLHGLISDGLDDLLSGFADTAFLMYESVLKKILPGAIQTGVKTDLNNLTRHFLAAPANRICPARKLPKELVFFDFQKTFFGTWGLNNAIGFERVNKAIAGITKGVSGVAGEYTNAGLLIDSDTKLRADLRYDVCLTCARVGDVKIKIGGLKLTGLDTIYDMSLLVPSGPYKLHNELKMARGDSLEWDDDSDGRDDDGSFGPPSHDTLGLSFQVALRVDGTALQMSDTFTVTLDIQALHLILDVMLKIDESRVWSLELQQLADVKAWLQALAAARPTKLGLSFGRFGLGMKCENCTSPGLVQMAANLRQEKDVQELTDEVNGFLKRMGDHFTSDPVVQKHYEEELLQYSEAATSAALNRSHDCVDLHPSCKLWSSMLSCSTNPVYMNRHCQLSCGVCTVRAPQTPRDESGEVLYGVASVLLILASGACAAVLCAPFCARKTVSISQRQAAAKSDLQEGLLLQAGARDVTAGGAAATAEPAPQAGPPALHPQANAPSLFRDPAVPQLVQVMVPAALACNIALFLTGHCPGITGAVKCP
jgi:hypothetical protein